jgi:hypothetical protein
MGNDFTGRNANLNININVQPVGSQDAAQLTPTSTSPNSLTSPLRSLESLASSATRSVRDSFVTLSLVAATSLYALLYYDLYTTRRLLKNQESWCGWKQHCTLDYLATQPRQELNDQLLLAIQERYMSMEDPTNSTAPVAAFLPALNKEIERLERYCYWAKRTLSWYCAFAVGVDKKMYEKAQEAIARLRFIKKIFIQWWATHNMQRHTEGESVSTRSRPLQQR